MYSYLTDKSSQDLFLDLLVQLLLPLLLLHIVELASFNWPNTPTFVIVVSIGVRFRLFALLPFTSGTSTLSRS